NTQFERAARGGHALGQFDSLDECHRNAITPADHAQAHTFCSALGGFDAKIIFEQAEKRGYFARGALPVMRGERVKRERADSKPGRSANHSANSADAGVMPFRARKAAGRS